MPGLVRKLVVFAAVDGLILQPLAQRGQRPATPVKISYGAHEIGPSLKSGVEEETLQQKGFEAFGVVGLLTLSNSSFLISITRRQQVAQIKGHPVYVVTEVALTPLASKTDAEKAVFQTQRSLAQRKNTDHGLGDSDSDSEDEQNYSAAVSDDVEDEEPLSNPAPPGSVPSSDNTRKVSAVEDVMIKKGGYGRFARNWFTKTGWAADQARTLGLSSPSLKPNTAEGRSSPSQDSSAAGSEAIKQQAVRDVATDLLPKLLRTTQIMFGTSKSFFFSYDHDITRSLANPSPRSSSFDTPLHKEVDPLFFWNRHLISPFIEAGQHGFVMPLMQGFVGQRSFTVDSDPSAAQLTRDLLSSSHREMTDMGPAASPKSRRGAPSSLSLDGSDLSHTSKDTIEPENHTTRTFLLTLISRRSIKRAGLRYLRRGIDSDGNTANSVETEQILSSSNWSSSTKTYSFLQLRGSIPVYFSQSPYSFKPVPQTVHSAETNYTAFKRHFDKCVKRYGEVMAASLVERGGNEAIVGGAYEKHMTRLNSEGGINGEKVGFEWFDFHDACRGMKFENVSLLMDTIGATLDKFGSSIESNGTLEEKQKGVLRTNCMDCLDRTNVVQSACGRRALEEQLRKEGFELEGQMDRVQGWFNTLWADNGDAISRQYASSDAMKGDFTRTRKRNFQGALKDGVLSFTRFYSGIVNDYFSQAAIDFLLGNATSLIFSEFASSLTSTDPSINLHKMRQQAIDQSTKLVIADRAEEFIAGWAVLTPRESNQIKSAQPFEEAVLLLTDAALYKCRFDWNMEKVEGFERVELGRVGKVRWGAYVTNAVTAVGADESRNVGLVVEYEGDGESHVERRNTRSLSTNLQKEMAPVADPMGMEESAVAGGGSTSGTPAAPALSKAKAGVSMETEPQVDKRVLAFKALPARSAVSANDEGEGVRGMTEVEQVKCICAEIERVIRTMAVSDENDQEKKPLVEESDIISLAEARKSTGIIEKLGYSLKRMVWA